MPKLRSVGRFAGAILGLSGRLDDEIGIPPGWRTVRVCVALFVSYLIAAFPKSQSPYVRAVVALFSVGLTSWAFNLIFFCVWRVRFKRVRRAKQLMREAAAAIEAKPAPADRDAVAAYGWTIVKLYAFLSAAFQHQIRADFESFMQRERRRDDRNSHLAAAAYLRSLEVKAADLDERFLMPQTFDQFRNANNWPDNNR